jgi:hypothetical protein
MTCPASVTKAAGRVRPSSTYAREGTAAHTIAEMVINGDLFPPPKITIEGQEFVVGRDMLMHLNPYIDLVQSYQELGLDVHVEVRVGLGLSEGLVWGTADCAAIGLSTLTIIDLKYGKGVPVPPDCAHLRISALGVLETMRVSVDWVNLIVCQPRIDPIPKVFSIKRRDLLRWRRQELEPAVERLVSGDQTEVAGPHCRWCVRRSECAAFAQQRSGQAADVFNDGSLDSVENQLT